MASADDARTTLSVRRSPNPWSTATAIALGFTVLMAASMVAAFATEHRGLALAPAVLTAFGIGLVVYTNTRRTKPETLFITDDAVEYVGQADRGLALTRPRSRAEWADVTAIAVVTWHKRRWIGLRTRAGAQLTGLVWVHLAEHDLQLMTSADSWEVPRAELVGALRLAGERTGVAWLGELTATDG